MEVTLQHDHTRHPFEFPCDGIDRISRIDAVKFKQIMNKLLKLLEVKHARFAIISQTNNPLKRGQRFILMSQNYLLC